MNHQAVFLKSHKNRRYDEQESNDGFRSPPSSQATIRFHACNPISIPGAKNENFSITLILIVKHNFHPWWFQKGLKEINRACPQVYYLFIYLLFLSSRVKTDFSPVSLKIHFPHFIRFFLFLDLSGICRICMRTNKSKIIRSNYFFNFKKYRI